MSPGGQANTNNMVMGKGAPAQNKKSDDLLPKLLLVVCVLIIGGILVTAIMVVLAAVIAAFVFGMVGSVNYVADPTFTLDRSTDGSTFTITMEDMGGATSVKGLWIETPYLDKPTLVSPDTSLYAGQSVTFSVPDPAGAVHVIAVSTVDGNDQVVLDKYI